MSLSETSEPGGLELVRVTSQILASHLQTTPVPSDRLPSLIQEIYQTFNRLGKTPQPKERAKATLLPISVAAAGNDPIAEAADRPAETDPGEVDRPKATSSGRHPAVHPSKSVFPDYIICLEDGKPYKALRRHLSKLGITREEYLKRWDLPSNYPFVAPNYSEARSQLAIRLGLGGGRRRAKEADAAASPQDHNASPRRRGKGKHRRVIAPVEVKEDESGRPVKRFEAGVSGLKRKADR